MAKLPQSAFAPADQRPKFLPRPLRFLIAQVDLELLRYFEVKEPTLRIIDRQVGIAAGTLDCQRHSIQHSIEYALVDL